MLETEAECITSTYSMAFLITKILEQYTSEITEIEYLLEREKNSV